MKTIIIQIAGMHCTSCALNIDFALEDLGGVKKAQTNYVTQRTTVTFDPSLTTNEKILNIIAGLNYTTQLI